MGQQRYRKDYSHHWPHVVGEHLALVPSERLRGARVVFEIGGGQRGRPMEMQCEEGMIREDKVNAINGFGDVLQEVPMLDAIIESRHAGSLVGANPCDPVHLNFVHVLGEDAGGAPSARRRRGEGMMARSFRGRTNGEPPTSATGLRALQQLARSGRGAIGDLRAALAGQRRHSKLPDAFGDLGEPTRGRRDAGCSMCLAMNEDRLHPSERSAATSNRNFEGRQGYKGRTHLVSPAMAAAAAVAGHFTDVREML